jgi:hypothetical protein
MKVKLKFTGGPTGPFEEEVEAEELRPGVAELRAHATFAPLGPGDVVETQGEVIVGVKHFEPLWTVEATMHLPAGTRFAMSPTADHPAMVAVAECEENWRRAAWVTRNTSFSFLVSAQTRSWLEENVEAHPYVEHVELVRTPDLRADLDAWLAHPAFA